MRKVLKKGIAAVLSATLIMGLTACGSEPAQETPRAEAAVEETGKAQTDAAEESPAEEEAGIVEEAAEGTDEVQSLLGETPLNPEDEYFGISLPMTNTEYYKGVETELSQYCEKFGIKYDMASADSDTQKQLSQFENLMTMGCTTIIEIGRAHV